MNMQALGDLWRRAILPVGCVLVSAWFLQHALFGSSGVLALDGIRAERERAVAERRALDARKARLEREIALLDTKGADPDYADELVRRHLGVIRPDEVLIPLDPPAGGG
jgi:cell division protein FtsB